MRKDSVLQEMISGFRHQLKLWFGQRVSHERVEELSKEVASYTASFCDQLVPALRADGIHVGHRGPALRREAIAFFAILAEGYTLDNPQRRSLADLLIANLGGQCEDFVDIIQERFTIDTDDSHFDGVKKVNILARTIYDRIEFYKKQDEAGVPVKVIIRIAFAAAHVLFGPQLADLSINDVKERLLAESGDKNRYIYPDELRDELVTQWLAGAMEPINKQFEDFFYVGEYHRLP
jgi:hypothetical protein